MGGKKNRWLVALTVQASGDLLAILHSLILSGRAPTI